MKKIKFWKENKLDKEYELTIDEIKEKFLDWQKTKKKDWHEYYCVSQSYVQTFVGDYLNSVTEDDISLSDSLTDAKWEYLNSIGIK